MYLLLTHLLFYVLGIILLMFPLMIPDPRMVLFTYIGAIVLCLPNILVWQRIIASQTYKHVEKLPKWSHLIDYIRRDNQVIPIYGKRAYPGESFLDVPQLGLIEFLGRDCYYSWGDKKTLLGLENINYSPDIRYSNLCHILWELGFHNSDDVRSVLSGEDLFLMGKVFQKMKVYDMSHGVSRLVKEMEDYDGKVVDFTPPVVKSSVVGSVHDQIDALLRRKEVN